MNHPLITIITPVYNGEKFIESCLQTVIDQQCSWAEHLIVDGASTDKTVDIIKRYAKIHPHIRWISAKDHGQSSAMNRGIRLARGTIIGILNCDDYYEQGVLHRITEEFGTLAEPSFLVGNCNVINETGEVTYVNKPARLSFCNILIGGEYNQFPYNPSAYFYHKSLHQKVGLYDENNHYTMDVDFIMRAVQCAHLKYRDETWGNFRFIKGTKTYQSKEDGLLELNKERLMNTYLTQLSLIQEGYVRVNRLIVSRPSLNYYMTRIKDCLRNPGEIYSILAKKMRRSEMKIGIVDGLERSWRIFAVLATVIIASTIWDGEAWADIGMKVQGTMHHARAPEPSSFFLLGSGLMAMLASFVQRTYAAAKRLIDILGSLLALIILSPVCFLVVLLIKTMSRGPAIFKQTRLGLNGKCFEIYKFRTMKVDAEKHTGPVWASKNDNRLIPGGDFLRRTHLDEIPQFINVLKGEMSIIGPRPERPFFVEKFKYEISDYEKRLEVKPGITGLAQVCHRYDETIKDVKTKVRYDRLYIKKMCFFTDVQIIYRTLLLVLANV